ncbi:RNA polymerase factor sigma-54 [Moraxella bovis]|uniref:RNA polymerase factor sigma-54 n=1 Tax=Moraxella bovis TaxID=476 RepID=UPI002226980E|nr:RNA polymerase factor sigma-54 [Moraxella bovis]UYZ67796.1 RNA polymerase factor sigma-54 [Moraxella bovis]UYZ70168.1 RNA polymerase factor sigma-54 [Moraxella bovis]UZA13459.1 RNA polymerase factor sigma-54 [Moraxella bovis]UZA28186.1 RNA polymerase factor sigma-54 [Moraxella bovis]UZA37285.1 RNA polymerase factor sigma-54 [Moraxella bovis]
MSLSFGLGVGLNQSQKLTPQMQQAIRLLALSHLELEQEVQIKLDSNPLLERVDESFEVEFDRDELSLDDWTDNNWQKNDSQDSDGFDEPFESDSYDKLTESGLDDGAMDSDWDNVYTPDFEYDGDFGASGRHDDEHEFLGATHTSIQEHVRFQMNFSPMNAKESLILDYLLDAMDEMGYIRLGVDELYQNLATLASFYQWEEMISPPEIVSVLQRIQACSPTGVGARNLPECLRLQLDELTKDDPDLPFADEAYMVLGATTHLETNNIKALMQDTDLSSAEIKGAMAIIRSLNPEPASEFYKNEGSIDQSIDIPDILVIALEETKGRYAKKSLVNVTDTDAWRVVLNQDIIPNLQINQEYAGLIKKGDDGDDNVYLKDKLNDARLFIRSIDERNQNLLKVASCIVRRQQGFLERGVEAMIPLTLKNVADEIGLHESTVSRLTTNKTMFTPQGLYPLKYFFSSSVDSEDGEVSSIAISAQIQSMIQNEDPKKPLSDAYITGVLEGQGVSISRRTVTKYREAMGILPSTLRKQKI